MAKRQTLDMTGISDLMADAIRRGLEKSDANMVRVASDLLAQSQVEDFLSEVTVTITDYRIADKSLKQIVLEAPDYIIDEIVDALKERRRRAEFGGSSNG